MTELTEDEALNLILGSHMTPDTAKILTALLCSDRLDATESAVLLAHMRHALSLKDSAAHHVLVAQDRDNKRRRIDIAMAILDEGNAGIDLEKVAAIVWPEEFGTVRIECGVDILGWGLNCILLRDHAGSHYNPGMGPPCTCLLPYNTAPGSHHSMECSRYTETPSPILCKHVGCRHLPAVELNNGYCLQHFSEGQMLATAPIDQPIQIPSSDLCGEKGPVTGAPCTQEKSHAHHYHLAKNEAWLVQRRCSSSWLTAYNERLLCEKDDRHEGDHTAIHDNHRYTW